MTQALAEMAKLFNSYGPVAVLLSGLAAMNGFFIWRDFKREAHQQSQLEELQRQHNDIVLPLLKECTEAIGSCREVIKQNSTLITGFLQNGR